MYVCELEKGQERKGGRVRDRERERKRERENKETVISSI